MTPQTAKGAPLSAHLHDNHTALADIFDRCQDVVIQETDYGDRSGASTKALIVYCSSFVSADGTDFLKDLLEDAPVREPEVATIDDAVSRVLRGEVLLLFEGRTAAIPCKARPFNTRPVGEPVSEPTVQGPREGTVERLNINLGMIRQRIQSPRLKVEWVEAGATFKTMIAYSYLEDVVSPAVLGEFRRRMQGIEKCDVPETTYVEDWIEDRSWTPFPQFRYTERTDTVAAALADGRIAVLTENSPMVLIAPCFFVDFFGTSEDYYVRTLYASLIRILRLFAFTAALTFPSIYIALSTFHSELIPTVLLLAILDTREGIPFPAFIEALIMEVTFELLREAGIRLPRAVGSAVSIVGALVIGQAAITAKIASPIMVIVVAFTGIASFAIPHYEIGIALRILRFPLMVAASLLGGFGLLLAFLVVLLHLVSMQTLGQPYLTSLAPLRLRDLRDIIVRTTLKALMKSPRNRRLAADAGTGYRSRPGGRR